MAELKEICGVWKKEGRSGAYYSGKVRDGIVIPAGSYVNIFKNNDATEENRKPALRVVFSEPEGAQATRQNGYANRGRADDLDDGIPF